MTAYSIKTRLRLALFIYWLTAIIFLCSVILTLASYTFVGFGLLGAVLFLLSNSKLQRLRLVEEWR